MTARCTYPCFHGFSYIITLNNIFSKLSHIAIVETIVIGEGGTNAECHNDNHQSLSRKWLCWGMHLIIFFPSHWLLSHIAIVETIVIGEGGTNPECHNDNHQSLSRKWLCLGMHLIIFLIIFFPSHWLLSHITIVETIVIGEGGMNPECHNDNHQSLSRKWLCWGMHLIIFFPSLWLLSHITIVETIVIGEGGINPVTTTITNPCKKSDCVGERFTKGINLGESRMKVLPDNKLSLINSSPNNNF